MPFDGINVRTKRVFDWNRDFQFQPVDRLDAAENGFLERQLRHLIPTVFMREFARINARTIFPVYFANDPGAETISYEEVTEYGDAEIVRDYASDAPTAEAKVEEFDSKVRSIRSAAKWTIQEVRAAARTGRDLNARKSNAARDEMLRLENRIAFHGDADFGLKGLFSVTQIPRDGAGQTFAAGTAEQNLQELHDLANTIPDETEDIESPDSLLLPPAQFDKVATQRLGVDTDLTVLRHFLNVSPHIRQVARVRELKGAGTGGVDVAVAFRRDIDKLRMNVALDLEQFPPERRGMVILVEYHMRVGGLIVHRPKSIRILEEV